MRPTLAFLVIAAAACGKPASNDPPDAPAQADAAGSIDGAVDAPAPPDATAPPNLVFVTSTTHDAAYGGLDGADAICDQRAAAAGHAGRFRAYLSSSTVNAPDRLGDAPGWVRPDGKPFARSAADVAAGHILYPPILDETGAVVGADQLVRTASRGDGTYAGHSCGDWIGNNPAASAIGGRPADAAYFSIDAAQTPITCDAPARLYCFQVDSRTPVTRPTRPPGHLAFLSRFTVAGKDALTPAGTADPQCTAEAADAGLPGTYVALLGHWQSSPAARVDLGGAAVVRPDGVVVAATPAIFTGDRLDAPIAVTADGKAYIQHDYVWTGAASNFGDGSAWDCNTWGTSNENSPYGTYAQGPGSTLASQFGVDGPWGANLPCDWKMRVYCLQQ